ncbi:MAG: universal stress protein [Solirubrobacterales bacterium]
MRRVFVHSGDSAGAADALTLARELATRTGAELSLNGAAPGASDLIVSERLLEEAPAALALAPAGLASAELRLERVAVGHDGSRESARALDLGTELAHRLGAQLTILGVVEPSLELTRAAEEERISRHLERALDAVPPAVLAESRLLNGDTAAVLSDAGERADLIVLGSRSHFGSRARMRPGSVGAAVARSARVPTVIATA